MFLILLSCLLLSVSATKFYGEDLLSDLYDTEVFNDVEIYEEGESDIDSFLAAFDSNEMSEL